MTLAAVLDLHSYFRQRQAIVDAEIDRLMPAETDWPEVLHKAMRYSVFSGGKRLRPILCLAAAEAVGAPWRAAILPAAAVELFHTYTLIHDDLPCMDDDEMRRGKPTCHVVFGEANAVLAGDALQSLAFGILAGASVPPPRSPSLLVSELARAGGSLGVAGGQAEDLSADAGAIVAEQAERIHLRKTADLFRAAVRMGAIAGGASDEQLSGLTDFAVNLGLAFQITDDILDAPPRGDRPAAPRERQEWNCVSVYGLEGARARAAENTANALAAVQAFDATRVEPLRALAQYIEKRTQ